MSQKTHILEILEEMIGETGKWFFSGVMIGTLKSAISRIQKEVPDGEWISVAEKQPEQGDFVLCFHPEVKAITGHYRKGKWLIEGDYFSEITHWMPLPNPPTQ